MKPVINDTAITLDGALRMTVGGAHFGGAGRIALLAAIARCGSITQAAKSIKMSYKAAWDAVDAMNNLAGEALVERVSGGKGGGGTRLTPRGAQLVKNFTLIERAHRHFIAQLSRQAEGIADDFHLLRRVTMKTSARNQFLGIVAQVTHGAVNDEIVLELASGQRIVATITHDSTIDLGLQPGMQASAMIKASSVILVVDDGDAKFSARNRMPGVVARVQTGAVNTEVVVTLDGGGALAVIITNDSCTTLGLVVGAKAAGLFNAADVILAIPA